ncbi:bacteriochlorophyll 4-vinyl reductase [Erythrobacter sp.]|jgi:divinyl protochlorophyllide a 8-vinyl-reductase|uniref:bacteriochlorophyll 4-vinyl reductase n=1 Tax=Erythrobacter sp. TaxID=1042 RepID=UPI002EABA614|nr:bacteriochlorophyll 4-vinyl reductase [Erythrobacter sp.]
MTRKARASTPGEAEIGPNAVLQTVRIIEERLGSEVSAAILAEAGLSGLPSGECMIRETHAIALHRALHRRLPREAPAIARSAGWATADYIIAHRIPGAAKVLLRLLPASLAAPLMMAAIRRHAWTFAGAGRFTPRGGWSFTIDRSRAGDQPAPPACLFEWYGAVFTRLFRELVAERCECRPLASESESGDERLVRHYRIARFPAAESQSPAPAPLGMARIDPTRSGETIANGSQQVTASGNALRDMIEIIDRASERVEELAPASLVQAGNLNEVDAAISDLERDTQQNAAMAEQSSAASALLNEEVARLSERTALFALSAQDEAAQGRRSAGEGAPVDLRLHA